MPDYGVMSLPRQMRLGRWPANSAHFRQSRIDSSIGLNHFRSGYPKAERHPHLTHHTNRPKLKDCEECMVQAGPIRFEANMDQLPGLERILPESQGQNLALTALYVPRSLDSGGGKSMQTWSAPSVPARHQIALFKARDLHWRSPESGVVWYRSTRL